LIEVTTIEAAHNRAASLFVRDKLVEQEKMKN
jgi:hypothetical protein